MELLFSVQQRKDLFDRWGSEYEDSELMHIFVCMQHPDVFAVREVH